MRRHFFLALLLCLVARLLGAAETHPFSVRDMLAMDRLSDPRVSPDGRLVAFTVSATDLASRATSSRPAGHGSEGSRRDPSGR